MQTTALAGGDALPDADAVLTQRRQSYWSVVGRSYWRKTATRLATWWALSVIFLTVCVPFIANDAPFTAVIKGQREFPLFRNLTWVDWIWFAWGTAASLFGIVFWRTGKLRIEMEQLRAIRFKWFIWTLAAAVVLSVGLAAFKSDYLDKRDYHAMAAAGELKEAVYAPLRWGYAEQETKAYSMPTAQHVLGTDFVGRDVLSRLLWGARVVLEIGLVSEIIALAIGTVFGAFMGYFVGKVDILGMRFMEIVEAVPLLFLLITFVAIFGRQLFMIMVIIGVTGWTGIARFVRAEFLRMRNMDYVAASKAMGLPLRNILFRHMLPNGLTPVIVSFTFGVAGNIVSESILSFLGIGVVPPIASWGSMLDQAGNPGIAFRWWLALPPGVMIFLTVFAYNIMGESMRDAIDPKMNKME